MYGLKLSIERIYNEYGFRFATKSTENNQLQTNWLCVFCAFIALHLVHCIYCISIFVRIENQFVHMKTIDSDRDKLLSLSFVAMHNFTMFTGGTFALFQLYLLGNSNLVSFLGMKVNKKILDFRRESLYVGPSNTPIYFNHINLWKSVSVYIRLSHNLSSQD